MKVSVQHPEFGVNYAPGCTGFISRKRDFVSAGINWFCRWDDISGIPISHTFIIAGMDLTVEAFAKGVDYGSLCAYLTDPNAALLVRRPRFYYPDLAQRIIRAAEKRLGEKYDYGLIVADALANSFLGHALNRLLGGWPDRQTCKLIGSDVRMICSELVAMANNQPEFSLSGFLSHPADTVTPQEIFEDNVVFEEGAVELT